MTDRNLLYVEHATLLSQAAFSGRQYHLRLQAEKVASHARPGQFVHLKCDSGLPMRRPMSIMRSHPQDGVLEFLYKVCGKGTQLLSKRCVGDQIDLIGPVGHPFKLNDSKNRPLLIGGGVGMPPVIFLAEYIKQHAAHLSPLVVLGSELPFPFNPRPSQHLLQKMPAGVIACLPLLDDLGIASRLASLQGYPGCFNGHVTQLADHYLAALDAGQRDSVELFACGPLSMLKAVNWLALAYDLPCQVALEEYMACAVGGCAGCTVLIKTTTGPSMQRVCVDGPVFDARSVVYLQDAACERKA